MGVMEAKIMRNMKKLIIFILICTLLCCATTPEKAARRQLDFINYSKIDLPPQSKDYPIDLFFEGKPQRNYEVIGQITGFVVHDYNIKPMLEEKIRQVGGDGVIDIEIWTGYRTSSSSGVEHKFNIFTGKIDQVPVTSVHSDKVINIKGKVIKYKKQSE
jgi:hypothetical protein